MSVYHTAHAAHVSKKDKKKLVAGQLWEQAAMSDKDRDWDRAQALKSLNLSSRFPKQTQQGQGCGIDRLSGGTLLQFSLTVSLSQYRLGSLTRDTIPLDDIVTLSHYHLGGKR